MIFGIRFITQFFLGGGGVVRLEWCEDGPELGPKHVGLK